MATQSSTMPNQQRALMTPETATVSYGGSGQAPATESVIATSQTARDQQLSLSWQFATFGTLLLAIVASRYLDLYQNNVVGWNTVDWGYLLFAAIVSLLVFPVAYQKALHNRNDPVLVRLGLVFSVGIGWQRVLSTVADLARPHIHP
jgi:hypothetical protein